MDNIKIQTTQNVDIEYEVASVGDRILATLLDYLFFLAYFLLWGVIAALTNGALFESIAFILIISLPILFYDLACELIFQGRSFGKMIMKIKVVKLDGTQAGFGAYLLRWLLRIIDTRLFSGVIALIAIVVNGKGQRVGDMAAGTTVIKMKQKVTLNDTILNKVKADYMLVFPEVSKLSDNDIDIIKDVMRVSLGTNNVTAIKKLADKTKATMGITNSMPDAQFLSIVVQDYSFYNFDK
ncbi:MAG: RDD family protein [Bacteroidetes bacterium]|nr:RDD family protein [Bacteroidota bacterium]